jgi:hypothetical protein
MRLQVPIVLLSMLMLPGCKRQTDLEKTLMEAFSCFKTTEVLGVPDGKKLNAIAPYLSKDLIRVFKLADQIENDYYKQLKEPEPPLSEGWNVFFGVYEGATSFKVLECTIDGEKGTALMQFTLQETGMDKPEIWRRSISLVRESGRWVFDDIIDVKKNRSEAPESLRTQLNEFIQTKGGTIKKESHN